VGSRSVTAERWLRLNPVEGPTGRLEGTPSRLAVEGESIRRVRSARLRKEYARGRVIDAALHGYPGGGNPLALREVANSFDRPSSPRGRAQLRAPGARRGSTEEATELQGMRGSLKSPKTTGVYPKKKDLRNCRDWGVVPSLESAGQRRQNSTEQAGPGPNHTEGARGTFRGRLR